MLSFSTDTVLRLLGPHEQAAHGVTEDEIHAMIEEGSEAGVIERQENTRLCAMSSAWMTARSVR